MLERSEPQKETYNLAVFNEYFPDGKIKELRPEEIPEDVMIYFELKSSELLMPEEYKPKNFEKFFVVTHPDNKQTFLAQQTKEYSKKILIEKVTYFADFENEKIMSRAELVFNTRCDKKYEKFFKNKPFVGWISTPRDVRKTGMAKRIILMMNAYSQAAYNLPLYSDTNFTDSGREFTEKLFPRNLKRDPTIAMCFNLKKQKNKFFPTI